MLDFSGSGVAIFESIRFAHQRQSEPGSQPDRLLIIGSLSIAAIWFVTSAVVYTDDAFIYFTVARNWAAGFGPVVNPGDSHSPVTGLAWAGILAVLTHLDGLTFPVLVRLLATGVTVGASAFLAASLSQKSSAAAFATPFALVSIELLRFTVGLEIHLALFMSMFAIWLVVSKDRIVPAAAVIGLGFFCRGDVILVSIPLAFCWVVDARFRRAMSAPSIILTLLRAFTVGIAVIATGLLLSHMATGSWLPTTLHAKVLQGTVGPWKTFGSQWHTHLLAGLGGTWLVAPLAILGAARLERTGVILLVFAGLQATVYSLLTVAHYPWYGWITEVAVRFLVCLGITVVMDGVMRLKKLPSLFTRRKPWLSAAVASVAMFPMASQHYDLSERSDRAAVGTAQHLTAFLNAADFIRENICNPSDINPPVVLTPAIGVLSYYASCAEYRDVNGLASPGITADNLNNWPYWVKTYQPEVLVRRRHQGKGNAAIRFSGDHSGLKLEYSVQSDIDIGGFRLSVYQKTESP